MVIYETLVPANTFYKNKNLSDIVVELEPLQTVMHFHYSSFSKNKECEIILDTTKKEFIADAEPLPPEFPVIIRAIHDEVTKGCYNEYERKWGTEVYNKIVKFLDLAKSVLPEEDLDDKITSTFTFNPDQLLNLKGKLNKDNNEYYAECEPVSILTNGAIELVDKSIFIYLENDNSLTLKHQYSIKGEERHVQITRHLPNDSDELMQILNYFGAIEDYLLQTFVFHT